MSAPPNLNRMFELLELTSRPADAIRDARCWLLDCFADEDDQDAIEAAPLIEIVAGVERHYEGGWKQFLADGCAL